MMIHPVGGMGVKVGHSAITPTVALNTVNVEFFGRTAHAGGAPWDGVNALDAANIAYTSISALRQQIHTTDRVHGIILKGGDAPNSECEPSPATARPRWIGEGGVREEREDGGVVRVRATREGESTETQVSIHQLTPVIPDHTAMKYYVRAQSSTGVEELIKRVCACFDGAAQATGCKVKYSTERAMGDLRNNLPISEEYAAAMGDEFHLPTYVGIDDWSVSGGSTDFGNVSGAASTLPLPLRDPLSSHASRAPHLESRTSFTVALRLTPGHIRTPRRAPTLRHRFPGRRQPHRRFPQRLPHRRGSRLHLEVCCGHGVRCRSLHAGQRLRRRR